ncbi:hypothetical protein KCU61_g815, partial [Aureobasidium melanogenum]
MASLLLGPTVYLAFRSFTYAPVKHYNLHMVSIQVAHQIECYVRHCLMMWFILLVVDHLAATLMCFRSVSDPPVTDDELEILLEKIGENKYESKQITATDKAQKITLNGSHRIRSRGFLGRQGLERGRVVQSSLAEEGKWMVQAPPQTIVVGGWFCSSQEARSHVPVVAALDGSSGCAEDQKSFRECGYTCRFVVHRHFAVADAWGRRGEKINRSQASRNCCGLTHSLIDASRAVALAPFAPAAQTVRSGAISAKASDDESCTFDSARLIRQDVPSLSPLCVDPCEAMRNYIMKVSGNNRVARHDIRFCSAHDVSGLPKSRWSSRQAHLNLGWCCKKGNCLKQRDGTEKCLLEDVGHDADGRAVAYWVKD